MSNDFGKVGAVYALLFIKRNTRKIYMENLLNEYILNFTLLYIILINDVTRMFIGHDRSLETKPLECNVNNINITRS